jgi:hypothetical protein
MDKVSFVIMLFRCFNNVWSNDMYYRVCAKWTYFDQNNFFFKVMVKITPTTYSLFTWNVTHHHKNPIPCERRVCGRCFCITFFFFFYNGRDILWTSENANMALSRPSKKQIYWYDTIMSAKNKSPPSPSDADHLDKKHRLLVELYKLRESKLLQIRESQEFY